MAASARATGKVDKIFLLTNNSDKEYIKKALAHFPKFDAVMDSTHLSRNHIRHGDMNANVTKSLEDVVQLFADISIRVTADSIRKRVLFFDNYPDHEMLYQIPPRNYIHITPDFKPNLRHDETRWTYVRSLLRPGNRQTMKKRHTRKL
jgi:hypothetical protein